MNNQMTTLATIHKGLCKISMAVYLTGRDVETGRSTLKAAIAKHHTAEVHALIAEVEGALKVANLPESLEYRISQVLTICSIQKARYRKALVIADAANAQRHEDTGMFQELIALRKAAKAEAIKAEEEIAPAFEVGQEVVLVSGQMATVQAIETDGQIKVRFICDTCSLTVSADKVKLIKHKDGGPTAAARDALLVLTNNGIGFGYNDRAPAMTLEELNEVATKIRAEALVALSHYHHSGSHTIRMLRGAVVSFTHSQMVKASAVKHLGALRELLVKTAAGGR